MGKMNSRYCAERNRINTQWTKDKPEERPVIGSSEQVRPASGSLEQEKHVRDSLEQQIPLMDGPKLKILISETNKFSQIKE